MKHTYLKSKRVQGNREIEVVDPEQFEAFFIALANDASIPLQLKMLVAVLLSSGARISEVLNLKQRDIVDSRFQVTILKKRRHDLTRPCRLHKMGAQILTAIKSIDDNPEARLFSFTRHTALKAVQKHFGPLFCNHSFRHSFVSWLLFVQKLDAITTAKVMGLDLRNVERYSHMNVAKLVDKLWAA